MIGFHFSQLWAQAESQPYLASKQTLVGRYRLRGRMTRCQSLHFLMTRKYWSYYRYDKSKLMFYLFIFERTRCPLHVQGHPIFKHQKKHLCISTCELYPCLLMLMLLCLMEPIVLIESVADYTSEKFDLRKGRSTRRPGFMSRVDNIASLCFTLFWMYEDVGWTVCT